MKFRTIAFARSLLEDGVYIAQPDPRHKSNAFAYAIDYGNRGMVNFLSELSDRQMTGADTS